MNSVQTIPWALWKRLWIICDHKVKLWFFSVNVAINNHLLLNKFFLFRLSFPFTRKTQKGIKRSMCFDTTFSYKFDVNILWLLTSIIIGSMNLKNKRKRRKNRSNWLWQFPFLKEVDHEMLVFYMTLLLFLNSN